MNAITDSILVDGSIHSGAYEPTPGDLHHGDITAAGLDRVEARRRQYETSDATRDVLLAAAGVTKDDKVVVSPQALKEARRGKLLKNAKTHLDPETLFPQLCKGAALRAIDTNDAAWLAQNVVNAVCDLAINEIIRRRKERGLIAGFNVTKDDQELWTGLEATNTDDMNAAVDNRSNDNLFSQLDDHLTIEATFKDWYREIETPLAALAIAAFIPNNGILLHGEYSRWVDSVTKGREQIIMTFEERLEDRILVANDNQVPDRDQSAWKDQIWTHFQ
jgi:hypothetical protein